MNPMKNDREIHQILINTENKEKKANQASENIIVIEIYQL